MEKLCELCGLPFEVPNGRYHPDCAEGLKRLRDRMSKRHKRGDFKHPWRIRLEAIAQDVDFLLNEPTSKELKAVFGDDLPVVEDLLIHAHLKLKEAGWRGYYA